MRYNGLYEVAYRDGHRVVVAHTLARDVEDAMSQFLEPVRAILIGKHHEACKCRQCQREYATEAN